ncbi:MAG: hypothetical protein RSC08_02435, partial [Oscillospiraceae bacterium]
GGTASESSVIYLTTENEFQLTKNLSADSEPVQLTDRAADTEVYQNDPSFLSSRFQSNYSTTTPAGNGMLWSSADGKILYFLARMSYDTATLYRTEPGKLKAGSDKNDTYIEKLDSGVLHGSVRVTPAGLLYEKSGDSGRRLYYYNGQESIKLLEGSWEDIQVTADGAGILYGLTSSDDGTTSLYYQPFASDGEKEKLATNVSRFYYTDGVLLYTKSQDDKRDVYTVAPGQESVKLISDVVGVRNIWGKSFYYTALKESQIPITSLVEGEWSSRPSPAKPTEEQYSLDIDSSSVWELSAILDGAETYDSWWDVGGLLYSDFESYKPNFDSERDSEENQNRYKTFLRERWGYTDKVKNSSAYEYAMEHYNEAVSRDSAINEAMQGTYTQQATELYFYDGTAPRLICGSVISDSVTTDARAQFALYKKLSLDMKTEKIKIEDVTDINDVYSWYNSEQPAVDTDLRYYTIGAAAEGELEQEGNWTMLGLLSGGKELILKLTENGELVSYPVQDGVLGKPTSVAEDASFQLISEDEKALYFYEDVSDGAGDLCRYQDGTAKTLASDVCASDGIRMNGVYTDDVVLALRDLSSSGGTLTLFRDGESTRVADDVTYYLRLSAQNILYLSDGNLYFYNGKEKQRLSSDVSMVWSAALLAGIMV